MKDGSVQVAKNGPFLGIEEQDIGNKWVQKG
jgi:hypothetical protein